MEVIIRASHIKMEGARFLALLKWPRGVIAPLELVPLKITRGSSLKSKRKMFYQSSLTDFTSTHDAYLCSCTTAVEMGHFPCIFIFVGAGSVSVVVLLG